MKLFKTLAVVLLALAVALGLAACGKKAATVTNTTPTTPISSAAVSTPSSAASTKDCTGYTSAMINGEQKCIKAGQQCQTAAAAQYPAYGFTCTNGVLVAGASAKASASSSAKAMTTCPSTGYWPAGTKNSAGASVGGQKCTVGSKLA